MSDRRDRLLAAIAEHKAGLAEIEIALASVEGRLRSTTAYVDDWTQLRPGFVEDLAKHAQLIEQCEAQLVAVRSTFAPYRARQVRGSCFPLPSSLPLTAASLCQAKASQGIARLVAKVEAGAAEAAHWENKLAELELECLGCVV